MPTNAQGQYITSAHWSHAPPGWLSQRGYPLRTGGQLHPEMIPVTYPSYSAYLIAMSQGNFAAAEPPGIPEPSPLSPTQTQMLNQILDNHTAPAMAGTFGIHEDSMSAYELSKKMQDKEPGNKMYNKVLCDVFRSRYVGKRAEGEIGLEIECEGMNLFDAPISWWLTHPDGSLRTYKDHPPIEYVLRKPISRQDVPKALDYLSKKLKQAGSFIADSHRTSVHVHVNCQDLTIKQIYQFWCLYTIFEEILVDFSGPDRPGNLFCLSSKQAEYQVKMLEQAIQTENFNEVFSDNLRYTSCNTASLGKFGSLEFRSMRGTVDQGLIQGWVDILLILKDKSLEYDSPREIAEDFEKLNSEGFLHKIFGDRRDILPLFMSRTDRHKVLWDGLRLMRDVAYAIKWDKRDPSLDKKKEPTKEEPEVEWVSNHAGAVVIEAVSQDVFLINYTASGRYYLCNYSFNEQEQLWSGTEWTLRARRMYQVSLNGASMGNFFDLEEHHMRPTYVG